jgi:hypothetical protein
MFTGKKGELIPISAGQYLSNRLSAMGSRIWSVFIGHPQVEFCLILLFWRTYGYFFIVLLYAAPITEYNKLSKDISMVLTCWEVIYYD